MNVSPEADRAFRDELQRTDPIRYARLIKALQVAALRQAREREAA